MPRSPENINFPTEQPEKEIDYGKFENPQTIIERSMRLFAEGAESGPKRKAIALILSTK